MSPELTLLILFLALTIGVSFLCSLCEAAVLTLTVSDAEILAKTGHRAGAVLRRMEEHIDRPLAAILTLNTIANTFGAAGVGAQAAHLYGQAWLGFISAGLTMAVLICSEIIPKTIGASHARRLAVPVTYLITLMIWITWPLVVILNGVSRLFKGSGAGSALTREQIEVMAEMARTGGAIRHSESELITNMLALGQKRVREVMTPRTVAFMLDADETVEQVLAEHNPLRFSRIPVMGKGVDDVIGMVLRHDIHQAALAGRTDREMRSMLRRVRAVPEQAPLLTVMEQFAQSGHHQFLVVDEYGGTAGVITLEDVLESILGAEIVDETDPVADMRGLVTPRPQAAEDRPGPDELPM